jgi:uncharacterized SAM-binding protein YcdF (DUF218 family)/lysophospholipase L1-like esterase
MICGVAVVSLCRTIINETTFPDRLIAPLLLSDSSARADVIVVLGAGVIGDCVPNLNGMRRVVRGARLFREGRAPFLVITGGAAPGECPVADAMARMARELGVPADKILVERESRSTWENAQRTAPLLRDRSIGRILLVTDRLHMRRAVGVFAKEGFAVEPSAVPIYEGHIDNVSMLSAGIHEAAALTYYHLRGRTAPEVENSEHSSTSGSTMRGSDVVQDVVNQVGGSVERVSIEQLGSSGSRPVVILGASYAANWKIGNVGTQVINAGIAGQQSFEMLARFDRDVVAARPRAVILWGFINDMFRADDMERSLARIRESYSEMIKRARAQGIEPILATEVTIRPPKTVLDTVKTTIGWLLGKSSYQDQLNRQVIAVNHWLRDLAQREGLLLLDLQNALADSNGQRRWQFATEDGSHISPEGYEALTNYAGPILSRQLSSSVGSGNP